jgi:hypothetical protein
MKPDLTVAEIRRRLSAAPLFLDRKAGTRNRRVQVTFRSLGPNFHKQMPLKMPRVGYRRQADREACCLEDDPQK